MIRAVVSDFGGVLTAPLLQGFALVQEDTGVPPEAFGEALARAGEPNPLFALEVGAITEAEFLATLERELEPILGRPVDLHGFAERYMGALDGQRRALRLLPAAARARGPARGLHEQRARVGAAVAGEAADRRDLRDGRRLRVRRRAQAGPGDLRASCSSASGSPRASARSSTTSRSTCEAAAELGFAGVRFESTGQAIAELDALLADGR